MRITSDQSDLASRVGAVQGVSASSATAEQTATSATTETSAATVTFSDRAQEISRAKAAVNAAPDVREDLVSSLKAQIDAGTYKVSGSDIADMMLRRHAADHVE